MRPTLLNFEQCVTAEHVAENVWRVARCTYSNDLATALEALVHRQVLEAIAEGRTVDPEGIAAAALKTKEIEFERTKPTKKEGSLGVVVNDPNGEKR